MMSSGRRWILIICLVVLLAAGVGIGVAVISGNHEAEKNAYIGISHLENGRGALAEDYLNRIGKWHGKQIQFVKDAAAALKEKMDGNNVLASIQSKQIQEAYSLNEKQQDVVEELQKYTATEAEMTETAGKIKQLLKIPEKRSKKYDAQYLLEYQAMESGRMRRTDRAAYAEIVSEEAAASLAMSAALSGGNYREAFQEAVQIVDKKPSAKNQLLLADIIAEGAHAGIYFTEVDLQQALGEDTSGSSSGQNQPGEEGEIPKDALAYRAVNAVGGIPTVEKQIVKAKLQYAVGEDQKAVKTLVKASGSVMRAFSDNKAVDTGLNLIQEIYKEGNISAATGKGPQKILTNMMDSVHDGLIIDRGTQQQSNRRQNQSISEDLSLEALGEYRFSTGNVYISRIDDSAFPEVSVTLYGRDSMIQDIRENRGIEMKDTHYPVQFRVDESHEVKSAPICFVVDVSGSMGGQPIDDAKNALIQFAKRYMDGNLEVALVSFESEAEIVTPVTTSASEIIEGAESLYDRGGTDLTAGISEGLKALMDGAGIGNIIMMTDGQSSFDYGVLDQANQMGTMIFTVGFGSVDEEVLAEIAENTGGTFTMADSSGDLSSVYASLGTIIGNQLTIMYTVTENPEETPRYFFIRSENLHDSDKMAYREVSAPKTYAETFSVQNSLVHTVNEMEETRDGGLVEDIVRVSGAYKELNSIRIHDQEIRFERSEDWEQLTVFFESPIPAGLYPAEFGFTDGSVCTVPDFLLVYDSEASDVLNYEYLRIGAVVIYAEHVVPLPDGTYAIARPRILDRTYATDRTTTLDASSENILILSDVTPKDERPDDVDVSCYDWGDTGKFRLNGVIYLNTEDAQNATAGNEICSAGNLQGDISPEQLTITEVNE